MSHGRCDINIKIFDIAFFAGAARLGFGAAIGGSLSFGAAWFGTDGLGGFIWSVFDGRDGFCWGVFERLLGFCLSAFDGLGGFCLSILESLSCFCLSILDGLKNFCLATLEFDQAGFEGFEGIERKVWQSLRQFGRNGLGIVRASTMQLGRGIKMRTNSGVEGGV